MPSKTLTVIFGLICLLAAGCAEKLTTEVTRFHAWAPPAGQSLRIIHVDDAQDKSLEFQNIAQMIGDRFAGLGYRPAPPGTTADIVVRVAYGVSPGPVAGEPEPRTTVGVGIGSRGSGMDVGLSSVLDLADRAKPWFERRLTVVMVRQSDDSVVFEGTATSLGRGEDINPAMPYLIDAMFANFPGVSGTTTRITVDLDS